MVFRELDPPVRTRVLRGRKRSVCAIFFGKHYVSWSN
jgi:hypothetical protein